MRNEALGDEGDACVMKWSKNGSKSWYVFLTDFLYK